LIGWKDIQFIIRERKLIMYSAKIKSEKQKIVSRKKNLIQKKEIEDHRAEKKGATVIGKMSENHQDNCQCASCNINSLQNKISDSVQLKGDTVIQLNCKYCGSPNHINRNCPNKDGALNQNHLVPVKKGKWKKNPKRKGHGNMTNHQVKKFGPGNG